MNRQLGFTIIELMVAIAVLGVLMGIGVPGMQSFLQNSRLISQINLLSTSLAIARSEAIKRNDRVLICVSTNGTACEATGSGTTWDDGWLVFVDRNNNSVVDLGPPGTDDCAVTATTDCIITSQAAYPGTNILTPGAGATGNINTSYLLTITALAPHTDTTCGALILDSCRMEGDAHTDQSGNTHGGNDTCWGK